MDTDPKIQALMEDNKELKWLPANGGAFAVNGLYWWGETDGEFIRLPKRAKEKVRPPVWDLAHQPSGARVRFRSDTGAVRLIIQHGSGSMNMDHMCNVGMSGIDLYEGPPERMTFWQSNRPTESREPFVSGYPAGLARQTRDYTLYLPTYNRLAALYVGLDADATVEAPSAFRLPKPVAVYGTSITQSGCASRGANGFVPVLGRLLGVDVLNLGFSGNGQGEPEMAELLAEIDAACFVMDSVANMSPELMHERYARFVEIVRAAHPAMPIVLMTRINYAAEHYVGTARSEEQNGVVLDTYERMKAGGDEAVYLFESRDVIGLCSDHPSVDGCHLTDLGFRMLAEGVAPVVGEALGLG